MHQTTAARCSFLSRRIFLALAGLGLAACAHNPSVFPVVIPTQMPPMETGAPTPAGGAATTAPDATVEVPRPSNPGGPGPALNLAGDPKAGALVFAANCTPCHNQAGHGGVANPGSTDGTVPALNPIDPALVDKDPKVFAYNLDLFITHGSTPAGDKPTLSMPAWGDQKKLTDQQIADVIAYVMSLNQP